MKASHQSVAPLIFLFIQQTHTHVLLILRVCKQDGAVGYIILSSGADNSPFGAMQHQAAACDVAQKPI